MKEFLGIQKAKVNPNFTTGMKRENAKRNRTPCVLPYEDNSIRLSPSRQNPDGYINASPISVSRTRNYLNIFLGYLSLSFNEIIFHLDRLNSAIEHGSIALDKSRSQETVPPLFGK